MLTNYHRLRIKSGHGPPQPTRFGSHASGSRVDYQGLYPAKADNLSTRNQPKKGTNHG
jgi:hypothetical protein